jgi:hypothetical protein
MIKDFDSSIRFFIEKSNSEIRILKSEIEMSVGLLAQGIEPTCHAFPSFLFRIVAFYNTLATHKGVALRRWWLS